MSCRKLATITTLALTVGCAASVAGADKVYWTVFKPPAIHRADLDGGNAELLLDQGDGLSRPLSIDLHLAGGKMYFTDAGDAAIRWADLDGANLGGVVLVDPPLPFLTGIALDVVNEKVYWCSSRPDNQKIQRANLDVTGIETLVTTGLDKPQSIALDVAGGKMYWTDTDANRIQRATLNGQDVEDLVTGLGRLSGIALDVPTGKMYWCNWTDGTIHRANMEIPQGETPDTRTDIEDLVTGLGYPNQIALDLAHGMMYWANTETEKPFYEQKIQRATLDGHNVQDIATMEGGHLPWGIALDVSLDPIPTLSAWGMVVMTLLVLTAGTVVVARMKRRTD